MFRKAIGCSLLAAGTLSIASAAFAQDPVWNRDTVQVTGNNCILRGDNPNVEVTTAGAEISFVFSDLGFTLNGDDGFPQRVTKECNIRIPASNARGFYFGAIRQALSYGAQKSAQGSEIGIFSVSRFFDLDLPDLSAILPNGSDGGDTSEERINDTDLIDLEEDWPSTWCGGSQGSYEAVLSTQGRISAQFGEAELGDIRYTVQPTGLIICPVTGSR